MEVYQETHKQVEYVEDVQLVKAVYIRIQALHLNPY